MHCLPLVSSPQENREALADANDFVHRHGLWSDGKRLF